MSWRQILHEDPNDKLERAELNRWKVRSSLFLFLNSRVKLCTSKLNLTAKSPSRYPRCYRSRMRLRHPHWFRSQPSFRNDHRHSRAGYFHPVANRTSGEDNAKRKKLKMWPEDGTRSSWFYLLVSAGARLRNPIDVIYGQCIFIGFTFEGGGKRARPRISRTYIAWTRYTRIG